MGMLRRFRFRGRIRPTGYLFMLVAGLVLLASVNTGTNLLYLLLGGVLSFIILSGLLTAWNVYRISGRAEAPVFVERGAPFYVQVRIENRRLVAPALGLRVEKQSQPGQALGYLLKLPARRAAHLQFEEVFPKRGVHTLPGYRLLSNFPFGLFDRFQPLQCNQQVLVHPRIRTVRTAAIAQESGARYLARQASGDGDEYFGLREYQPGDDMRHIAWRVSARMGSWFIREWARDNSRFIIVALDTYRTEGLDAFEDRFEEAVELAASLTVTMLHRNYSVGIAAPGTIVEPAEGTSQERRILDMLARVNPAQEGDLDFAMLLQELSARRATIVCLSPDPARWGRRLSQGSRYLDPREVVHA